MHPDAGIPSRRGSSVDPLSLDSDHGPIDLHAVRSERPILDAKSAQSPAHMVTAVTPRLYSAPPRSCSARTTLTARRKNLYLPVALPVDSASPETWPQSKTALYGLIFPILPALTSVNQRLPSGPVVMKYGLLLLEGVANSVMVPEGVTLPTLPALSSVNQRLPSGPVVM